MDIKSYDLFLDIDFQNLKFMGKLNVMIESEEDVVLNSVGLSVLKVNANERPLQFEQRCDNLLIKTGSFKGLLEITYTGLIPDILAGIYRAPYENSYIITTQFEAANARRMFPCIDHPGYKAEFKLTLRIDRELDAISNMPLVSIKADGCKKIVEFQKTPKMSTYLLYLGLGKFEEIMEKLGDIKVSVATPPSKVTRGKFALEVAKKSIRFYESYFDLPYMLPKIHLIMVPEFAMGAMENWGAVTFRETALLIDENSSVRAKKRVFEVVAHELAHMWFGDLVTMKWWDDLWLNESFATFIAYKVIDKIQPEWKTWQDFLIAETATAMSRDSIKSTHPIQAKVESPNEIEQIFDDISYGKGASVLRMIETYMGEENFTKGIQNFLKRYKYSNADGNDFWNTLEQESSEVPIKTIAQKWIEKPGYPIITACFKNGKLLLRQERFLLSNIADDIWPIPVVMKINGELRKLLLDEKEKAINIGDLRSLKLNIDQTGFYRVYYEGLYDLVWKSELSTFDRWGIIFDAFALLMIGKISFSNYLHLLGKYYTEPDYLPALEVSNQLATLFSIAPSKIARVSKEFHQLQLKSLEDKNDENSFMLRGIFAGRLAMSDENYAKKLGSKFEDYARVEPDMKDSVAIAYARGYNNLETIVKKFRESDSDEERVRLLVSMMCFREPSLIAISLGLSISGDVKRQDVGTAILATLRNPDARDITWTWLRINIAKLAKIFEGTGTLSSILIYAIPILGIGRVEEAKRFFKKMLLPDAEKGIEAGLDKLEAYDRLANNILETQYAINTHSNQEDT